jgi:hypothetical protein
MVHTQLQSTAPSRLSRNNYRTTARVVGVVYLAGMVVGIGGNALIQSILGAPDHLSTIAANGMILALGAVLWLFTVAGDAAHGILMFPVLKPHSERAGHPSWAALRPDQQRVAYQHHYPIRSPLKGTDQ